MRGTRGKAGQAATSIRTFSKAASREHVLRLAQSSIRSAAVGGVPPSPHRRMRVILQRGEGLEGRGNQTVRKCRFVPHDVQVAPLSSPVACSLHQVQNLYRHARSCDQAQRIAARVDNTAACPEVDHLSRRVCFFDVALAQSLWMTY